MRIKSLKFVPPVARGYRRSWRKCNVCGVVAFRDFIPFSLSNPILVMPCGHSGHHDNTTQLTDQEGMALALEQHIARKAVS